MAVTQLRQQRDALKSVTVAIPAAGANVNTPTIDLGSAPFHPDDLMVEIVIPALPNQTDPTKTLTIQLQNCATTAGAYANTDPLLQTTIIGVAVSGSLGKTVTFRLPPNCLQFIQLNIADGAGDGNNTASSVVMNLLF